MRHGQNKNVFCALAQNLVWLGVELGPVRRNFVYLSFGLLQSVTFFYIPEGTHVFFNSMVLVLFFHSK